MEYEDQTPPPKKKSFLSSVGRFLGIFTIAIVILGVKYFVRVGATSAEISYKNSSGQGWNEAKPHFQSLARTFINGILPDIPEQILSEYDSCSSDALVSWSNSSGCSYYYNKSLMSEEEHLHEQQACLAKAGYDNTLVETFFNCAKSTLPNSWAVYGGMFETQFTKSILANIDSPNPEQIQSAGTIGKCVSADYTNLLNTGACMPIDINAGSIDTLFTDCIGSELKKDGYKEKIQQIWQNCTQNSLAH